MRVIANAILISWVAMQFMEYVDSIVVFNIVEGNNCCGVPPSFLAHIGRQRFEIHNVLAIKLQSANVRPHLSLITIIIQSDASNLQCFMWSQFSVHEESNAR